MADIEKQAKLYAESFRYKIDDAGWYDQKVRDFMEGYKTALRIHNIVQPLTCVKCGGDYFKEITGTIRQCGVCGTQHAGC